MEFVKKLLRISVCDWWDYNIFDIVPKHVKVKIQNPVISRKIWIK
jgi:hypothetical protein